MYGNRSLANQRMRIESFELQFKSVSIENRNRPLRNKWDQFTSNGATQPEKNPCRKSTLFVQVAIVFPIVAMFCSGLLFIGSRYIAYTAVRAFGNEFSQVSWFYGQQNNLLARHYLWNRLLVRSYSAGISTIVFPVDALSIHDRKFSDADLTRITQIPTIRYVNISGTSVSRIGIRLLLGCDHIQSVQCFDLAVSIEDLEAIRKEFPGKHVIYERAENNGDG